MGSLADLLGRTGDDVSTSALPPPRLLLTAEQAAYCLGIGRTQVFKLIRTGELASVQIGRLRRVPATACRAYVDGLEQSQA